MRKALVLATMAVFVILAVVFSKDDLKSATSAAPSEIAQPAPEPRKLAVGDLAYTSDDAVGCNFEEELINYQQAMIQFDWNRNNRIEDGETVEGCRIWRAKKVTVLEVKEHHVQVAPDGAEAGWMTTLDLHN